MTVSFIVVGAVLAWLAIWLGVVGLIGRVAWRPLADRYPADRWPEGEGVALSWQSGSLGLSRYNGVLNAVLTGDGLYLRPVRAFAFQHPPLFIPWTEVEAVEPGFFGGVKLRLPHGAVALRGRLGALAEQAAAPFLALRHGEGAGAA
jgi:hypothetical protein